MIKTVGMRVILFFLETGLGGLLFHKYNYKYFVKLHFNHSVLLSLRLIIS